MLKLLIFDVGGVIDNFDESMYIDFITKRLHIDHDEFRDALIPLLDSMELGNSTLADMMDRLSRKFGVSKKALEWDSAFERLNSVNWDVINLINRLSKKYRVAILTNVSRSRHIVKMEQYLEKVKYERLFTSCYLRMAKPDPKFYRFVLKEMGVKPDEAIFVDNLKKNTDGAERVGIKSIQFINYRMLVRSLGRLGVK
jgi:epoxide hydrolase-like predicted phosphatase